MNLYNLQKKSKIKSIILELVFIAIFILCITSNINIYAAGEYDLTNSTRAYFCSQVTLGHGNGDCILLENYDENGNKVYGLIDAGRNVATSDDDGKNSTVVIEYLKEHGVHKLDFFLITHSHGDHNGDATSVINNFEIDKIYMKEFDEAYVTDAAVQKNYENILKLAIDKNIPVIGTSYLAITSAEISPSRSENFIQNYVPRAKEENFTSFYYNSDSDNNIKFKFGSATLEIFNWEIFDEDGNLYIPGVTTDKKKEIVANENNNSLGILLTQGSKKAFFAGDMNNLDENTKTGRIGDEDRIKDDIGKVDLLKLGHHGHQNSNTEDYINVLHPDYAVITNAIGGAYKDIVDWLNENNVDYLYTTVDDFGVTATITENSVYLGLETTDCFRNINGTLYYIPAGSECKNYHESAYKVEYQEKQVDVNSWAELKNAIEQNSSGKVNIDTQNKLYTVNSLIMQMNSSGDWSANDTIKITEDQKVTLVPNDDIVILRDPNFRALPLFDINGELNIGTDNMTNSITLNGNKENTTATSTLIKIERGVLNLYNNTILRGNMNKTNSRTKSGTTKSYTSFGSAIYCTNGTINMYGGKIIDNNTDVIYVHTLPKSISNNYNYSSYGSGIYMTKNSVLNMYGGEISNNTAENHSVVSTSSDYTTTNDITRGVTQAINGVAIYASSNSQLNLLGGKITGNKALNYSQTNIKTAKNSTIKTDIYSLSTSIHGVGIYLSASKCTIKNGFILSDNTAEEHSKINIEEGTKVTDSVNVGIKGTQAYFNNSNVIIDGLIVNNGKGVLNVTGENKGQIGSDGTESISPDIDGGAIDIYKTGFTINNLKVNNCNQTTGAVFVHTSEGTISNSSIENTTSSDQGGALYVSGACNIKIDDTLFKGNKATAGGAIYVANTNSTTELNNVVITNNSATTGSGGGVYAFGNLIIGGDKTLISENHASTYGGGIMVKNTATLNGGTIENNIAEQNAGGGIRVDGTLTMNGGVITKNVANTTGGGIDFTSGKFTLNFGTISGNKATSAGNEVYPEQEVPKDTTVPKVTILEFGNEWTNKSIVIDIVAEDAESGIKDVKVNNNSISKSNDRYTYEIAENGTYEVFVTDNAGNETKKQFTVTNIDKIAPIITGVAQNAVYNDDITVNAIDSGSGIKSVKLMRNNSEVNYKLGTPIKESGNYEISVEDNVSNKMVMKFSIDKALKNDDILIEGISKEWKNSNQMITITVNKQIKSIKINGSNVKLVNGKYELTVTENSRLYYRN